MTTAMTAWVAVVVKWNGEIHVSNNELDDSDNETPTS